MCVCVCVSPKHRSMASQALTALRAAALRRGVAAAPAADDARADLCQPRAPAASQGGEPLGSLKRRQETSHLHFSKRVFGKNNARDARFQE